MRLDKGNFAGAKLPRYEALRGERPPDLETTVILPESVFRGQWRPKGWVKGQVRDRSLDVRWQDRKGPWFQGCHLLGEAHMTETNSKLYSSRWDRE